MDRFNFKIIESLLPVFDLHGDHSIYFLEALAVIEKQNIFENLEYNRSASVSDIKASMRSNHIQVDFMDLMRTIVQNIENKERVAKLISKRMTSEVNSNVENVETYKANRKIINGLIIKELSLFQFSKIVSMAFVLKTEKSKKKDANAKFMKNLEKDFDRELPLSTSIAKSFIDTRLKTSTAKIKIRTYVQLALEKRSNSAESSLEDFSNICLSILNKKEEKSLNSGTVSLESIKFHLFLLS